MKKTIGLKSITWVAAVGIVTAIGCAQQPTQHSSAGGAPQYQVEPFWPKPLKDNWIWGQVSSVAVDSRDHVWVLHRPSTLLADDKLAQVRVRGFAAPTEGDPASGLTRRAAHERFESTGGSLYYLSNFALVQGSELVRIELHDGITGLPLEERHLLRGRDYTIDYLSGRILLTQPLSMMASHSVLGFEAIIASIYTGPSWMDGKDCVVLDYSKTSLLAHWVRDEIRLIGPGFYLGKVYWSKTRLIDFSLQF